MWNKRTSGTPEPSVDEEPTPPPEPESIDAWLRQNQPPLDKNGKQVHLNLQSIHDLTDGKDDTSESPGPKGPVAPSKSEEVLLASAPPASPLSWPQPANGSDG